MLGGPRAMERASTAEYTKDMGKLWLSTRCGLCYGYGSGLICLECKRSLPWSPEYSLRFGRQVVTVFHYEWPVDWLIRLMKFHGRFSLAYTLGELLTEGLVYLEALEPSIDFVLPVPAHPLRLRTRGFNPAHEIAQPVARRIGAPILQARRVRNTKPQSLASDDRERRENVKDAFAVDSVTGRVVIVDDVITTGATAQALAQAVANAGGTVAAIWVVARSART